MQTHDQAFDFIAIGLGPFNLSLACLTEPLKEHRGLFLERNAEFNWHPGMLIEDSTLQNPFLADLVSLADPTSRFSYLNYCKQQGKIFSYFIRENFYLTRCEYNRYCRWAAARLKNVRFHHEVTHVHHDEAGGFYVVSGREGAARRPFELRCRRLVIGIGSTPLFPACCASVPGLVHSANYLEHKERLQSTRSITVVGSGQSAAEVYRDLLKDSDRHGYALHWITRSPRFFAMDTNKLAVELLCPDYIDHFFALPDSKKERIAREHRSVYTGINARLINEIYDLLDEKRGSPGFETHLLTNAELRYCRHDTARGRYELRFFHTEQERDFMHRTEAVVFGTGYAQHVPSFIEPIRHRIRWDERGRYDQARNYSVDVAGREIYVQNAGFHRHGFTSPDLGLACHRNAELIRELTGLEYYSVDYGTALQDFGPRAGTPWFEIESRQEAVL
nr:SidA/IucD/PvdA family monooxygenase [uncultured Caldimonas sp.]